MNLEGRVAVVTGASRGLGAGLAEAFLARGMRLGLCARSPLEAWTPALAESAQTSRERLLCESLDVVDPAAVSAFAERVWARFGAIDLWINNAAVLDPIGPLRDQSADSLAHHLAVNVVGVATGSQAFVRLLRRAREREPERSGVLINVSSGAARRAYAGWGAYCASKAAVDRLTEVLQVEEYEHGLRAFAVAPGVIDTEMQEKIRSSTPEQFPEVERFWELKRSDAFNSTEFVAERLLELAFESGPLPTEVLVRLPAEHELRSQERRPSQSVAARGSRTRA